MNTNSEHQKRIEHQFDSFCKTVLRNHARNIYEETSRRNERLISIESLTPAELSKLSFLDVYDSDYLWLAVFDYDVPITDVLVAQAIESLSNPKQDIILLSFFLEMANTDIATLMNLAESTIHYHKTKALKELKNFMEEHANDE
ncbi:sigma-70 family RNA polymerase sigma factor [Listeria monocytogenes]|nr:sigma-70 family RNA polymerase sigma factor [Listeria monocytogenes]